MTEYQRNEIMIEAPTSQDLCDDYNYRVLNKVKYYIKMISYVTSKKNISYRKNKCVDGWSEDKTKCWKFTKYGALKKIESLKHEYKINYQKGLIFFELEEAE